MKNKTSKNFVLIIGILIAAIIFFIGYFFKNQIELKVLNRTNDNVGQKNEEINQETGNDTEAQLRQQLNADKDNTYSSDLSTF